MRCLSMTPVDFIPLTQIMRSSSFEGMLLKATWPSDEPVQQALLDEIIKYSIPAFKYGRSVSRGRSCIPTTPFFF